MNRKYLAVCSNPHVQCSYASAKDSSIYITKAFFVRIHLVNDIATFISSNLSNRQ